MVMYEKFSEKIQSSTKTNFSLKTIKKLFIKSVRNECSSCSVVVVSNIAWLVYNVPMHVSRHEFLKNFSLTEKLLY